MTGGEIPTDPAVQISPYLAPGERLLWAGRPDPGVRFAPVDALLVPFSVMWGGFAIFWEAAVLTEGGPPFFVLWGVPFVLVGLYFVFGRFVYKRWRKRRTAYGITNTRAIVAIGNSRMIDSPVTGVPTSTKRSRDGRHVSITFGSKGAWSHGGYYANTGMDILNMGDSSVGFFDVTQPEALIAAVERARSG
jgi:hypothetical protein